MSELDLMWEDFYYITNCYWQHYYTSGGGSARNTPVPADWLFYYFADLPKNIITSFIERYRSEGAGEIVF